ncbi:MAG TPA: sodium:solute symporter [Armatimonadota bacterium]|jgi:SSS family solute:Na+ symporter
MNLTWIDWTMMVVAIVALRLVSLKTRSYMNGVADFLSANRSAGRYLLTIASGMGNMGVISFVALFQMYWQSGFTSIWWGLIGIPTGTIIALTGWVYYRQRESRAMTLAQLFEMRYSRNFRIFSGLTVFTSGIVNFGIFPAVAANFFIYFCGLPLYFHIPGIPFAISTFALVMAIDLILALTFVNMGGQISVMVTECVQGMFSTLAFVIIIGVVLSQINWAHLVTALSTVTADASMLHPFHAGKVEGFNFWYFIMGAILGFYGANSWQGTSGFNCAARTPHEQKMGQIIGFARGLPQGLIAVLLPVAAFAFMKLPEFSQQAQVVTASLAHITNPSVADQMRVPIILAHLLPVGIKGLLAITFVFFSFTCHDTYMHSWGSIFIQDVVMPFRKKPLSPEQHVNWLRYSIIGVALFAFIFSLFYTPEKFILMFFQITGTIWLAGAGAVIVGGLYTKWGTTAGAYGALIVGAVLGVSGLFVPDMYKAHFHRDFPLNSMEIYFFTTILALVTYTVISLLTGRNRQFNLDRMLHRGAYAEADAPPVTKPSPWEVIVGITSEFSTGDKLWAVFFVIWNFGWWIFFMVVTVLNLIHPFSMDWWSGFWHVYVWIYLVIGAPMAVVFTIGGIADLRALFVQLKSGPRDHTDDGRVVRHADNEPAPCTTEPVIR